MGFVQDVSDVSAPPALPTISDEMQPGFFGMAALAPSATLPIRHIGRGS
jgi:hypothetical protein